MNKLEFDSINLSFGERSVLSNVYMSCEIGEVVGLLGRNGSGKSSLFKVVFGSLNAHHKSVRVDGAYLSGNYLNQRIISYLPQDFLIPDYLTFEVAVKLLNVNRERLTSSFPEVTSLGRSDPGHLSGGQRRLLEVLLILYAPHPFCLLDEPFSGLMPLQIEKLVEILKIEKERKGIIISDHLHQFVRQVASKIYLLNSGSTHLIKSEEQLISFGYLNRL